MPLPEINSFTNKTREVFMKTLGGLFLIAVACVAVLGFSQTVSAADYSPCVYQCDEGYECAFIPCWCSAVDQRVTTCFAWTRGYCTGVFNDACPPE